MSQIIEELKQKADVILLDTPPLTVVADAAVLSKGVDGGLLVVRSRVASRNSVLKTKELLTNAKSRVLGAALNCSRSDEIGEGYYSYYSPGSEKPKEKKTANKMESQ